MTTQVYHTTDGGEHSVVGTRAVLALGRMNIGWEHLRTEWNDADSWNHWRVDCDSDTFWRAMAGVNV